MVGGGPFGRRALLGLGEKDGEERAPPQADWRLHRTEEILAGEAKGDEGGD